jgi:hypothetical protein
MKKTTHLLLFTISLLAFYSGFAQSVKVFDVFSNEEYSYVQKYKEVKDFELNLNQEFDIDYFAMRNENGQYFDQLNATIENLALNSWKSEQGKFELSKLVKAQIAAYNDFSNRKNDRNHHGISNDYSSYLKSIDILFLSICNNTITFSQNYSFVISSNNQRYHSNEIEINVTKLYTADLYQQKINPLVANFNEKEIAELEKVVLPLVSDTYGDLGKLYEQNKYKDDEDDDEGVEEDNDDEANELQKLKSGKKSDPILHNMSLKGAYFYWFGWGLMVHFPMYSSSTYVSNGEPYNLFIPLEKCKPILYLFPVYASFSQIVSPAHQFINFDYYDILNNYNKFRSEPNISSLFRINNAPDKPSKLKASSYQLFKNNTSNYRGLFVYEYDKNKPNFQRYAEKTNYRYFLENNNGKTITRENEQTAIRYADVYDKKGNLIIRKSDEPLEGGDHYFFYNKQNCYLFSIQNRDFFGIEKVEKITLKNGELCLSDMCLIFNESMQVVAIKTLKYQFNNVEIGFDEKGRLVEAHTENDRYNYYFEFDALDRLTKYSTYEYQRVSKEVEYFYTDDKRLPYLQKKHTYNNDTMEEERYELEY